MIQQMKTKAEMKAERYQKRLAHATTMALQILKEYGGDYDGAKDRVLIYCNGQAWLERMVLRQMREILSAPKKKQLMSDDDALRLAA